jgi:uncharacterized membrane protein YfhO
MRIDVETPRDGLLLLSEIHYPCWKALVDGKPAALYRVDYALRAIAVPAGKHTVSCSYDDSAFSKGRNLSLASLFIVVGALGLGWRWERRTKQQPGDSAASPEPKDKG